jgi:hypothetical protein
MYSLFIEYSDIYLNWTFRKLALPEYRQILKLPNRKFQKTGHPLNQPYFLDPEVAGVEKSQ